MISTMSRTTIECRLMQASDLPAVLRIQHLCYQPEFHEPLAAFQSKLDSAPAACWVLTNARQQVQAYLVSLPVQQGDYPVLHATQWQTPTQPNALYLHDMAVLPSLRGMGAATNLLQQATQFALNHGWQHLNLIAVQNSASFWKRHGFSVTNHVSEDLLAKLRTFGTDAQLMAHHLSQP